MARAQDNDVVKELATQRANKPLHIRILPWTLVSDPDFLDATALQKGVHLGAIDPVIVTKEIARVLTLWCGLAQLLNNPSQRWALRNRKMNHPPPAVLENDKDVVKRKVDSDHGEEVNGPGNIQMVAEKRQPSG